MATGATQILGATFFKHKYLTNPLLTPEDLVIAVAKNLARELETSIPQHLWVFTTQALKDLSEVFRDTSHKYSNDPAIHMPDLPPSHPHQEPRNLQGCHPLPMAHHLQGCTLLQFLKRYPAPYLLTHPPVSRYLCSPPMCPVWVHGKALQSSN
jgi:hypothetical protein